MTVQSFTVQLSTRLYNRLKQRADRTNRSIEIEMVEAVAGALPADDMLPTELADALAHWRPQKTICCCVRQRRVF
jgi:predicted transcriptional regulator